jgi:hypothetical protein
MLTMTQRIMQLLKLSPRSSYLTFKPLSGMVEAGKKVKVESSATLKNPRLWGPPPTQVPNRYVAVTTIFQDDKPVDQYETPFGIRSLRFDANSGIYNNGELIKLKGVDQHHDLRVLGSAFNTRAAERQLEILREMGCNAIRMSHNPSAPELLELTDRMGFLVMDEVFDVWVRRKTPRDFSLIFPDWHEQDLKKTASIFISRTGARNCLWRIYYLTGIGRNDKFYPVFFQRKKGVQWSCTSNRTYKSRTARDNQTNSKIRWSFIGPG